VKSAKVEGWLATIGGILANVLPVIGWLSVYLGMLAGSTTGSSGAFEGVMFGMIVSIVLGGVGVIAWLGGVVSTIVGLARGRAGSPGRGLVFAGLALNVLAVIGWLIEWAILFAVVDTNKGAFRM
jgi:hypothetical protein